MKRTNLALVILMLLGALLVGCDPKQQEGGGTPTPSGQPPTSGVTAWHYLDQPDPTAPALMQPSAAKDASQLKPDWQLDTVEYVDSWWGLGTPGLNDQTIKRDGPAYRLNITSTVSVDDVQNLVKSLDNLYPAQMLMQGLSHTDDYPSWAVEMVGTDGQHVLLFASSTGNPGNGPWTILYNGRLYAQYDGAVAAALGKLFSGRLGSSDSEPFGGSESAGENNFATSGLPAQLIYGFWGLLPISNGFSYTADSGTAQIKGTITGSSRIGSMEIGQITELKSVQITAGGGQVSCTSELLPEGDSFTPVTAWSFICPVKDAKNGDHYLYPIKAGFATDKGDPIDVSGELWGIWRAATDHDYILLPPSPEIQSAIATNTKAQDLLTDHILGGTRYSATLTADKPMAGRRTGEAILFGQTQLDGTPLRYTIGARFVINDGKLDYWDLDRASLDRILRAVAGHPLTTNVLAANPHVALNMWFVSGTPPKEPYRYMQDGVEAYAAQVNACGSVPGGALPAEGKPFMAFDYNASPYFYRAPFVMIGDTPVVSELTLYPADADPVQKTLLPSVLDTRKSKPFDTIFMETTPYSGGGPTLHIHAPEKATTEERAVYQERLKALPVQAQSGESEMVVHGVTLAVTKDGKLDVVPCSAQSAAPTQPGSNAAPPKLAYSTFYGSTTQSNDNRDSTSADAMAIDSAGNAYITGMTSAVNLPLKDPLDSRHMGDLWADFVAKIDPTGASLLYGTYLNSGDETTGEGIAVDLEGNIYITGSARSNFGGKANSIQPSLRGDADAYVVKLSADGKKLIYATLLGGKGYDTGYKVAVDKDGNAYITGETESEDFHIENPLQAKYGGKNKDERGGDVFVAKISPDGSKLIYSTYLGGKGSEAAYRIMADDQGNAYVTGYTDSDDFPTANPLQPKNSGGGDAFLAKISPDGSKLVYSTFLGGTSGDVGAGLALDPQGNIYITGNTSSPDFPLKNPLSSTFNSGVSFSKDADSIRDAFIVKLNPEGSALLFSTFLGGSSDDRGRGIGLDTDGNIYVGGSTTSPNFPLARPLQDHYAGGEIGLAPDSFITKLNPDATALSYSTYFGGEGFDGLTDFAVDPEGGVYFAGESDGSATDFPLSDHPYQSTHQGIRSAYIAKIVDK